MSPPFAELVAATNFSFLRGASHPGKMALTALLLGHNGIGIADRNSVAGVVRAYAALKELREKLRDPPVDDDAALLGVHEELQGVRRRRRVQGLAQEGAEGTGEVGTSDAQRCAHLDPATDATGAALHRLELHHQFLDQRGDRAGLT